MPTNIKLAEGGGGLYTSKIEEILSVLPDLIFLHNLGVIKDTSFYGVDVNFFFGV